MSESRSWTYRDAGVDIDAATEGLSKVKPQLRRTFGERVLTDIGSFGGLFDAKFPSVDHPVLVSSCDGVGTKLKLAFATGRHDTIGADLVNHCINDILVQGAKPLFFLDYFATGKLSSDTVAEVVGGMARACEAEGVALIGGETAEMPGMYADGEYDLAGFIVGMADKSRLVIGDRIQPGHKLIALPSTGLHTNGYSLAQKVAFDVAGHSPQTKLDELGGESLGDALLRTHRCYLRPVMRVLEATDEVHGMVHITGGGLYDNIPRVLPSGCRAVVDGSSWQVPPLFRLLTEWGNVPPKERFRVFNMGIGYVLIVPESKVSDVCQQLRDSGEQPWELGGIEEGETGVTILGVD
ncbi:MAG: phosphoribosylformylglycinamidine cyclo-ligase [Planctomycetota bacterium]